VLAAYERYDWGAAPKRERLPGRFDRLCLRQRRYW
jgi:hypothetical protein